MSLIVGEKGHIVLGLFYRMPGPVLIPCRQVPMSTMCPYHWAGNHIHRVCWKQPLAAAFPWTVSKSIWETKAGPSAMDVSRQCHLVLGTNAYSQEVQEKMFINTTEIYFHYKVLWKMSHTFLAYSIFYSRIFSYRICLPQTQRWSLKWHIRDTLSCLSLVLNASFVHYYKSQYICFMSSCAISWFQIFA